MIKLKDLLNEINIISKKPIEDALAKILKEKNVSNQFISNWFLTQYLKWFISPSDDNEKSHFVSRYAASPSDPEWRRKNEVFNFKHFTETHIDEIKHIIDYFNTLDDNELRKIHKINFSTVRELVKKWDVMLSKKMDGSVKHVREGVDIETLYKFSDGSRMVKIISNEARKEEGDLMGHCVGGDNYSKEIILSLRDSKGMPHVTMQLEDENAIVQIKGKQNSAPVSKYVPYVVEFIEKRGYTIERDGENVGFLKYKSSYYNPESEEWKRIYVDEIIPHQKSIVEEYRKKIVNGKIAGDVDIRNLHFDKIPDIFRGIEVAGEFYCNNNRLTSLEGSPRSVGKHFICNNNQLTTLEGSPRNVGGGFYCGGNILTSLEGSPVNVGESFNCSFNQLTSLEGGPESVGGDFHCGGNILTSLEGSPRRVGGSFYCNYNRLTSLEGSPRRVGGRFDCRYNQLISLEGGPESVGGSFYCDYNRLTSLEGAPESVGGNFHCSDNKVKFSNDDVKKVSKVDGVITV